MSFQSDWQVARLCLPQDEPWNTIPSKMPYYRDYFEYKCAAGHLNKIDKAYFASEPDQLSPEPEISFPDKLPCSGCQHKLVPASPVRVLHCALTEVDFYKTKDDKYAESAAYHEAGHTVVAAVQQMPLNKKGLRIDQKGAGMAYYQFAKPDGSTNLGPEVNREQTIRSTQAGYIAQEKFYLRFCDGLPPSGAFSDVNEINALVEEMYTGRDACDDAKARLAKESQQLVEEHWQAIEALAQALWSKQWERQAPPSGERRWSTQMLQRTMRGAEVVALLQQFQIVAVLEPD